MNSVTVRTLLVRGMLAGLAAGVVAFVFAYLVGEGPVDAAIAFESANSHEHGGEELVSRTLQSTAGLATGVLVFGVAIGGIAALAFCFALGRIGRFGARATAGLTALAGFLLVYLVPILKYPANPPAVGNPDTISERTVLFVGMIALSVLLGAAAILLGRRLAPAWGNWNASITAGVAYVAAIAVAMVVLPTGDNTPKGFPANDLWEFRVASIGIQAVLWAAFGLAFGFLAERVLEPQPARGRVSTLAA
ncbi:MULTISPECIES: CbtA family protein [unclassified Streptomyces]|uniref:CbtA family protein n=1 Tax=unclassified Streptomyces TaxID=2593676 RepID=UPI002365C91B|nr:MULTISPECIES: CbtA family protein [unclassified Streptomyces]MDF3140570.1 CbtA family protein [Streptomyces sp. T21Q-yed]WDF44363.1 CbtA family protein [Streptomyces sp. T12]